MLFQLFKIPVRPRKPSSQRGHFEWNLHQALTVPQLRSYCSRDSEGPRSQLCISPAFDTDWCCSHKAHQYTAVTSFTVSCARSIFAVQLCIPVLHSLQRLYVCNAVQYPIY